jgi:DNA repair photolyase
MVKRTMLVLGVKKGVKCTPFYRSCDFIAPSQANGCAIACVYCYVARRKGFANLNKIKPVLQDVHNSKNALVSL